MPNRTVTVPASNALVGTTDAQTLTNKTIAAGSNTISGISEAMLSTSDVTTGNVSASKHGFAPKAPNDAAKFLDGTGAWGTPAGTGISTVAAATDYNSASRADGLLPVWDLSSAKLLHKAIALGGIIVAANDSPAIYKAAAKGTGGSVCDGTADDVEWQTVINAAQTAGGNAHRVPEVHVAPGNYANSGKVTFKSAPIIGMSTPNNGIRVTWEGAAGGTMFDKDPGATSEGGSTYWECRGISFLQGSTDPGSYFDFTGIASIDNNFRVRECQFGRCDAESIKIAGWVNLHWYDLRFDNYGTFAVVATPSSGQPPSTFKISGFTADSREATARGFIHIDNTANASNLGTCVLENGRIEINTNPWVTEKGIFVYTGIAGGNARACKFRLDDVTYQDSTAVTGDCILYSDFPSSAAGLSLMVTNSTFATVTAVFGGTLPSGWPTFPVQGHYHLLSVNPAASAFGVVADGFKAIGYSASTPFALFKQSEANARWAMDQDGKQSYGPGSGVADLTVERSGVGLHKVTGKVLATAGIGVGNSAAATSLGTLSKKMEVFDASGTSLGFVPIYTTIT